jgi:Flp pilus assembly protein TadD
MHTLKMTPSTPDQPGALQSEHLFREGNRCLEKGEDALALAHFTQAVKISPGLAEAHANIGLILEKQGDVAAAEAGLRHALQLAPEAAQIHLNLGALLLKQKRFIEAETSFRNAIAAAPINASAWSNLGVLYACTGREAQAEHAYRTAILLAPGHANARFNLSYILLRQGRFREGWEALEARQWQPERVSASIAAPRWQGEPLENKSLLIAYEAGHGDMIQFCRYAALVKERWPCKITLVCHPALGTLFAGLSGVDRVISLTAPIPDAFDYWVPLLSLPFHCGTRLSSIPAKLPYLQTDPQLVRKWAARMPAANLRVGLAWRGNPNFENDHDRSIPALAHLAPLWKVPGVAFISLQKGAGENEAANPPAGQPLLDPGSGLSDFADTAGLVTNLDLVISVDTAVAHLAGALNKPCWVLLPAYRPDWRWLADRRDTPWYPGVMRLFRQTEMGDWGETLEDVARALGAWAQDRNASQQGD